MLPLMTVVLVLDSFATVKYPYRPAVCSMREHIPMYQSFAWVFLCALHPQSLKLAVTASARKMGVMAGA